MTFPKHEFLDSLQAFTKEYHQKNLNAWLATLSEEELLRLEALLQVVTQVDSVRTMDPIGVINKTTDISLLAFEVAGLGKRKRVLTLPYERRMKILDGILNDVQIMLLMSQS